MTVLKELREDALNSAFVRSAQTGKPTLFILSPSLTTTTTTVSATLNVVGLRCVQGQETLYSSLTFAFSQLTCSLIENPRSSSSSSVCFEESLSLTEATMPKSVNQVLRGFSRKHSAFFFSALTSGCDFVKGSNRLLCLWTLASWSGHSLHLGS